MSLFDINNMEIWQLLTKELKYYGIHLIDNTKCTIYNEDNQHISQGVIKTIDEIKISIKKQKKILKSLWDEIIELLKEQKEKEEIIDEQMLNLFIFSLKDLLKYLRCFDGMDNSIYYQSISTSLVKDSNSFSKKQIYKIPDYKIAVDWITRTISRLLYISKLLTLASMGKNRVAKLKIKMAKGIEGPWSHLDLPLLERVFPFGTELQDRSRAKQMQRRYRKGLEEYNSDFRVGEGHFWRELRNEPFSWANRAFDDPYPSRSVLSR